MKLALIGLITCMFAVSAFADPLKADIECYSVGVEPIFDCVIKLVEARTLTPVSGAKFSVSADMPSMTMAHNIRPVTAVPSKKPGIYKARLALEMYGTWTVVLRISSPVHGQIHKTIDFFDSH